MTHRVQLLEGHVPSRDMKVHLLDPVRGASDFDVPEETGVRLIEELRNRLPGYAVPRLAREHPGSPSKTWLA